MVTIIDPSRFLEHFAAQFEGLSAADISVDTEFRQLPDQVSWSLVVIASFDWEYGVTVSAEELKAAKTIGDLFQLVVSKAAS
ncbi:MAG: acyl carrier protein [Bacteroidia bacterium]